MALIFGNTARAIDDRRYAWTFYVRGNTEHVEEVTIKLHPTFKDPVRTCTEAPFEFKSRGWGTFPIDVLVKWRGIAGVTCSIWPLQFDEPDKSKEMLSVPAALLNTGLPPIAAATPSAAAAGHVDGEDMAAVVGAMTGTAARLGELLDEPTGHEEAQESHHPPVLPVSSATGGASATPSCSSAAVPAPPEALPLLRSQSAGSDDGEPGRASMCSQLRSTPFLEHGSPLFMHGRGYSGPMQAPKVLWKSDKPPRKDHSAPKWLTATEYEDCKEVMVDKVKTLANLIRHSRKTVAYTGAGISAAVIGQAALSGQNTVGWKDNTRAAPPTFTHHALGFLGREGLLHGWVQQNHDGLPQKAGFPQERINEIHGSWYDPCNPVVKYSGTLHDRSYPWMREDAETADLVLVLGTSLGGLNADQVATKTAERSLLPPGPRPGKLEAGAWVKAVPPGKGRSHDGLITSVNDGAYTVRFRAFPSNADSDDEQEDDWLGGPVQLPKGHRVVPLNRASGGLGTVCINLQQTAQDGKMTLRMFGKSDDVLRMLVQELGYTTAAVAKPPAWPKASRVLVPYGPDGRRLEQGSAAKKMWLDLRSGQEVKITDGHNIQGAKQPQYMHITGKKVNGVVLNRSDDTCSFVLRIEGAQMRLGFWWLVSAMRGGVEVLPIVNRHPQFEE
mmetsp:Transcript_52595/g.125612  ORF Transcript_52595/g.125612 Transcript_52595/m.125612 type:complete len:670 (+) Transcript_52595:93-2102(+)